MTAPHYFNFIGSVWDQLSEADKSRMSEMWKGYEQLFGSVYQKFHEVNLNIAQQDLQPFDTERWLPYDFSADTELDQPAIFTSTQDISQGINLFTRCLLNFSIDGGTPIEVEVAGADPASTQIDEVVDAINTAVGFTFAASILDGALLQFTSPTSGVNSSIEFLETSIPAQNASEFLLGILSSELPVFVPEFPLVHQLPYEKVASIPELRDAIRDESVTDLRTEGVDYEIQSATVIAFKTDPTGRFWSRRTLFDEETPFNNYGFLMDIFRPSSQRYVDIIQSVWFAFWTGPKPSNVQKTLYLLFGLPTANQAGTVTTVTATEIVVTNDDGTIDTFEIATGLVAIVAVGDRVARFDPLTDGINVFDKISKPGFIKDDIGRAGIQNFLTENATRGTGEDTDETKALTMLEEYTNLLQISVDAFISSDISLDDVSTFLTAIKPLNKTFIFQVFAPNLRDELELGERDKLEIEIDVTQNVDSNVTTFAEQTILDDYETIDNSDLDTDQDGVLMQEAVNIEVRSFGLLIDTFDA
jgi:hypothetical protein